MCKILNVSRLRGNILLDCSEYDGNFEGAKTLRITDGVETLETQSFILEKTRPCFSKHNAPWIMLTEGVDERFLKKGNNILLQ